MQPVTLIIPAYNEEKAIGPVLAQLTQILEDAGRTYEIIVVDDGSEDETADIAEQAGGVNVVRHRANKGYGAALKTGIRLAQHEVICITDADGTYPNERIPELVQRLEDGNFDMVIGARTGQSVAMPFIRRPAKWFLARLAHYVAGEPIPDLNSGLRVFKRPVALRLFNILPAKFSFTTTITLAMLTNQYLVDYVPINYYARIGKSKIRPIQDTLNFIQLILRIGLYFAPLKIFLPLSLALMLLGIFWGTFTLLVFDQLADVSTLVLMMSSFQVMMIGLLAELINRRVPNVYRE